MFDSATNVLALSNCPLREGLKARLKNKGSKRSKIKRAKYETPQPEHPETVQNIQDHVVMHSCRGFKRIFAAQNFRISAAFQYLCKKCSRLAKILIQNCASFEYILQQVPAVKLVGE
jgi:hypothetical protein